jgi:hypothetical protein
MSLGLGLFSSDVAVLNRRKAIASLEAIHHAAASEVGGAEGFSGRAGSPG